MNDDITYVKESTIKGAGKGVFATRDIEKNTKVLEYTGKVVTSVSKTKKNGQYTIMVKNGYYIDGAEESKTNAHLVNDVYKTRRRTNLRWSIFYGNKEKGLTPRVWMVSTRKIKKDAELFIAYGDDYWYEHGKK